MLKTSLKIIAALALAFVAYLFWQAGISENVRPDISQSTTEPAEDVLTIAFGSCNRQDKPQDYWSVIGSHEPGTWLWLGDNIYADRMGIENFPQEYAKQKYAPPYADFVAGLDHLYGIYDDHDYGINDGGKEFEGRETAKAHLLRFLDVPEDAAVRTHAGSYQSYTVGQGAKSVKIILLDTRYFRDAFAKATVEGHRYGKNLTGDILGEEQWAWLESELTDSPAAAHVIASTIQVLAQEHAYEKWENFPAARKRLLALLKTRKPNLPLLLSGDRHIAEISRVQEAEYPVYEITASGLTHSYEGADEPNRHRISGLIDRKNYGLLHYVFSSRGPELLAEVRSIDDDGVLASLSLNQDLTPADKSILSNLVHANKSMPETLKPCPNRPNCVSTQTDQKDKKRNPIAYSGSLTEAKAKLRSIVEEMKRTELITESENYLHYTFKTWPIPFTDDVEFLFDEEAKLIHFRSASRVGHSDLGVNGKRMAKVKAAFSE